MIGPVTHVRFVAGSDGERHRRLTGVFAEAEQLRRTRRLSERDERRLDEAFEWFSAHVPVPPFRTSGWHRDIVCWYRPHAREAIARTWELVGLLRDHDVPTRMLRSTNPGKVVYQDEHQVVVDEWRSI